MWQPNCVLLHPLNSCDKPSCNGGNHCPVHSPWLQADADVVRRRPPSDMPGHVTKLSTSDERHYKPPPLQSASLPPTPPPPPPPPPPPSHNTIHPRLSSFVLRNPPLCLPPLPRRSPVFHSLLPLSCGLTRGYSLHGSIITLPCSFTPFTLHLITNPSAAGFVPSM